MAETGSSRGDDDAPIALDEYVLRRIHKNMFTGSSPAAFQRTAFQPNRNDTKGISVFRETFVAPEALANAGAKAGEYYVIRLSVREIKDVLDLSVVPDPQEDQLPGHALIPELRTSTPKHRSREVQRVLAKLAGKSIVHEPQK